MAAPVLLVVLRFVQGLGLGGEWGGAVLMSLEHGEPNRRGWNASRPQVGVPAGNLLAAGVLGIMSATLSDAAFESWGWRVPFLLSGALIAVGLWIRMTIAESPLFQELEQDDTKARAPILDVLKLYPKSVLTALGAGSGSTSPSTPSPCSSSCTWPSSWTCPGAPGSTPCWSARPSSCS